MNRIKKIVLKLGWAGLFAYTLVFSYTFLMAYFDKSKSVLVTINQHGEAHVELILLLLLLPSSLFVLYYIRDKI